MFFKRKQNLSKRKSVFVRGFRKNARNGFKTKYRKVKFFLLVSCRVLLSNKLIKLFCTFILIGIVVFFIGLFLFSSKFDIRDIEVEGAINVDPDLIQEEFSTFLGRNIFFIRSSSLKRMLDSYSPFVRSVRVEKKLPGTIIIILQERDPSFVWINFSGSHLVDSEGVLLETIANFDSFEISQEDIDILRGYGSFELIQEGAEQEQKEEEETSKENEAEGVSDETSEENQEKELSPGEKRELVERNRQEIVSRVDRFWKVAVTGIAEEYNDYPFVYSYDQQTFNVLDELDANTVSCTEAILDMKLLDEEIRRYVWESEFQLVIFLQQNREIVFSTRRDFDKQVNDLAILLAELKRNGNGFHYIDLSSEVVVYEIDK